jgi:hypothetical protein
MEVLGAIPKLSFDPKLRSLLNNIYPELIFIFNCYVIENFLTVL